MNLDDSQRKTVVEWIAQGLKLSEIQTRLAADLGITMTYMDVRLLVDDLKLTPKDVEPAKSPAANFQSPLSAPPPGTREPAAPPAAAGGLGGVSLSVDQVARPGARVSGKGTVS